MEGTESELAKQVIDYQDRKDGLDLIICKWLKHKELQD